MCSPFNTCTLVQYHTQICMHTARGVGESCVCYSVLLHPIQPTMGHSWHVHQRRRGTGDICQSSVTGGHFDPFLADVGDVEGAYDAECGPNAQLRCEMGDLSAKHGRLTIEGAGVSPRSTFAGYDANLHLAGPYTGTTYMGAELCGQL